jgi:hypothetical protein
MNRHPGDQIKDTNMTQNKGQIRALEMLAKSEAGVDVGAAYNVGADAVFFTLRFGRFLRFREQHPDDRQELTAWHQMDVRWGSTTKKAPEQTRFAELIAALPAAIIATKAEAATVAANGGIAPEPTPEPEPIAAPAPTPEPEPEATTAAPALDPVAAKRERKTIAQRLRRAAAKASVQWRGDPERTAAAES